MSDEKPALVVELIRLVARVFYRDEHVVVLDRLARAPFIRDDDLRKVFELPEPKVRHILRDLQTERLVACDEKVSENKRKVSREVDIEEMVANAMDKSRKRARGADRLDALAEDGQRFDDDETGSGDSDSSGDEGEGYEAGAVGGAAGGCDANKRRSRVSVSCWYINPRWFVDVVNYRLYLMRRHLGALEAAGGSEAAFRCSSGGGCPYVATLLEAEARRVARNVTSAGTGGARGICSITTSVFAKPNVAIPTKITTTTTTLSQSQSQSQPQSTPAVIDPYSYLCALCGALLTERRVEAIATAAKRALDRLNAVMRTSGVELVLRELDAVPLGALSPRQLIFSGKFTLHGPSAGELAASAAAAAATAATGGERAVAGGGAAVSAGGGARVYAREIKSVDVAIDGLGGVRGGGGGGGGGEGAGEGALHSDIITVASAISAGAVPAFLRTSYLTGQASTQFGFVGVIAGDGGVGGGMGHLCHKERLGLIARMTMLRRFGLHCLRPMEKKWRHRQRRRKRGGGGRRRRSGRMRNFHQSALTAPSSERSALWETLFFW